MDEIPKIKLVFCTDGLFPLAIGGIQRHSTLLIKELAQNRNIHISVIHPHPSQLFAGYSNIVEYTVSDIDTSKNYIRECYNYSKRVESVLCKLDFDIVYAQGLTVWYNIKKYSKKLINNPHGLESFQAIGFKEKLVGSVFKRIQLYIFRHSSYIASEGGHLTTILRKYNAEEKVVFLPNAVLMPNDRKVNYPNQNEQIKVFFMARFVKNKGIHLLFEAIRQLNALGYESSIQFVLGGKGPLFEEYNSSNKFTNVQLRGFLSDEQLQNEYLNADVFILPTLFEGMPTVVLEAMSFGLPVIVSDVGGTSELVDKTNGYLIQRNEVDQIIKSLLHYFSLTSVQKKTLGDVSRHKVESKFTWTKLAEQHYKLFLEIIERNS